MTRDTVGAARPRTSLQRSLSRTANYASRGWRLFKVFSAQFIKRLAEYRVDFLTGVFAFLFIQLFNVLFIFVIFQSVTELDGWNLQQIIFIYGFSLIPRGIDHLLTDNLWVVAYNLVRKGDFDKYLTRPIDPWVHTLLEGFKPDALGELITGFALIATSLPHLAVDITFTKIVLGLVAVAGGTLIYTGIKTFFAALAFWIKRSGHILYMAYQTSNFVRYPVTIYNEFIRNLVTYVIPFAFTAFFPASYLLTGKDPLFCIGGTVLAGAAAMIVGRLVWTRGISAYESAGS